MDVNILVNPQGHLHEMDPSKTRGKQLLLIGGQGGTRKDIFHC